MGARFVNHELAECFADDPEELAQFDTIIEVLEEAPEMIMSDGGEYVVGFDEEHHLGKYSSVPMDAGLKDPMPHPRLWQ